MQSEIVEGQVLAGKYRVERVLGRGGMGVVVAAHHLQLDQRVAIKFLLPEALENPEALARFAREARAAVKIKSEHVARVSDVGTLASGAPYMVMEYLEGSDLSAWLERQGRLPLEQAAEFILQACEAIAEAHALGIVHRDLKPANLFVIRTPAGALSVKVLDFGISKLARTGKSAPDVSMTKTSAMMGSPLYMSPEQLQSPKDVDSRSDVWALGVIFYELVTGECPFVAETLPELVAQILSTPYAALRSKLAGVPSELEGVIAKCLERDRNRRYESVATLAAALLPYAPYEARISLTRISGVLRGASGSPSALLPPSSIAPAAAAASQARERLPGGTQSSWGKTEPTPNRSATVFLVAAGLLSALAGVTWFLHRAPTVASGDTLGAPPPPSEQTPVAAAPAPSIAPVALAVAAAVPEPSANASRSQPAAAKSAALPPIGLSATKAKATTPAREIHPPKPAVDAKPTPERPKNPLKMRIE